MIPLLNPQFMYTGMNMFRFFRKIRFKLLDEGYLSKYSYYAIGEILLVVIGILIALQINNWNELRKEHRLEIEYISRIIADLDESIEDNGTRLTNIAERNEALELVVSTLYDKKLDDDNRAEFIRKALYVTGWTQLVVIDDTFEELKSTGNMAIIRSSDVRGDINKYLRNKNEYNQTLETANDFLKDVNQRWRSHISPNYKITTTNEEFMNNPEIYKLFMDRLMLGRLLNSVSVDFHEQTKSVREILIKYSESI